MRHHVGDGADARAFADGDPQHEHGQAHEDAHRADPRCRCGSRCLGAARPTARGPAAGPHHERHREPAHRARPPTRRRKPGVRETRPNRTAPAAAAPSDYPAIRRRPCRVVSVVLRMVGPCSCRPAARCAPPSVRRRAVRARPGSMPAPTVPPVAGCTSIQRATATTMRPGRQTAG